MARYDYGLRGFSETARRRPGRPWHLRPTGEDPRDASPPHRARSRYDLEYERAYRTGWWPAANRVTARYNRDYVHRDPEGYGVNYNPYAGDTPWRVGDYREFDRPYQTRGGSSTSRGGRSMGWERDDGGDRGGYHRHRGPGGPRYGDPYRHEW